MAIKLYSGENTYTLELVGLRNASDQSLINDATVEVTLYKTSTGISPAGTWPITLTALGSAGAYTSSVTADLDDRTQYDIFVRAESGSNVNEWTSVQQTAWRRL
jgi:hypothetical protein